MDLILELNCFKFDADYFLRIHGTSVGTPVASTYVNTFTGIHENNVLNNALLKPTECLRYVYEILIIWEHEQDEMDQFVNALNSAHHTIRFAAQHSM